MLITMNQLSRLYAEIYDARRAREEARGTPRYDQANARVAAAFEAVRTAQGFGK
jgi:hypothetical protein